MPEIPLPPEVDESVPATNARAQSPLSPTVKSRAGAIRILPLFGQIEGHTAVPESVKSTRYEEILPLLCALEEDEDCRGILLLINTVGGDVEAGLAIAELIAGMNTPSVSLILGGGHSIGLPLAVSAATSFVVPSATLTLHPVRFHGLVLGVEQSFDYFRDMQERIATFVCSHAEISKAEYFSLILATGNLANDTGTILGGREAVRAGLIDRLGGVADALACLKEKMKP